MQFTLTNIKNCLTNLLASQISILIFDSVTPPPVITIHKHRVEGWSFSTESVHNHSENEGGTQGIHTFTHHTGGGREDH